MSKFSLRGSLRLWLRRRAWRRKRLAAAHRSGDPSRVAKWGRLLEQSEQMISRRRSQLNPMREKAYREAVKLIGVLEHGGNNAGADVARIIRGSDGNPAARPAWCGYTMGYVYRRAGSKLVDWRWGAVRLLGAIVGVRKTSKPQRGDLVRFEFNGDTNPDHVGMFVRDLGNGEIETIEGNTGATGAVSDSTTGGDGVYRKQRPKTLVRDYIHITR